MSALLGILSGASYVTTACWSFTTHVVSRAYLFLLFSSSMLSLHLPPPLPPTSLSLSLLSIRPCPLWQEAADQEVPDSLLSLAMQVCTGAHTHTCARTIPCCHVHVQSSRFRKSRYKQSKGRGGEMKSFKPRQRPGLGMSEVGVQSHLVSVHAL